MAQDRPGVTLMIPGLLSAIGRQRGEGEGLPHLERLLRRARSGPAPCVGFEAQLCSLFGVHAEDPAALPTAAISALVDLGDRPDGYWLRADPVHLRPDQARLVSLGNAGLDISVEEARALVASLAGHFAEQHWEWHCPAPDRWYLRLPAAPALDTVPLVAAIGRNVDAHMPAGDDSPQWHAWLNEIQMLLYTHPVNQRRQDNRQPLINSVWFWGGGTMPESLSDRCGRLWSDDSLALGLAAAAGVPRGDCPASGLEWLETKPGPGQHLVVLTDCRLPDVYDDAGDWLAAVERLDRDWIGPLARALRNGQLSGIELWTGGAENYHGLPADRWAFWRNRSLDSCYP